MFPSFKEEVRNVFKSLKFEFRELTFLYLAEAISRVENGHPKGVHISKEKSSGEWTFAYQIMVSDRSLIFGHGSSLEEAIDDFRSKHLDVLGAVEALRRAK